MSLDENLDTKKATPLISVIVPVYNVESYLNRCVKSIVNQSYKILEIIMVDDGSSDNCSQICNDWAKKDSRIKLIHKCNGGLSEARNTGMKYVTGEFISFVDSDDWIADQMIDRLFWAIEKDQTDIASCSVMSVCEDQKTDEIFVETTDTVLDKNEAQRALLKECFIKEPVWCKLYKRTLIQDIFFEKGKYNEDAFWSYQAIGNSDSISIVNYTGYYYWQRKDSIMGEKYSFKRLDAVDAKVMRQKYFHKFLPDMVKEGAADIILACLYHGQKVLKYLSDKEKEDGLYKLKKVFSEYSIEDDNYSILKLSNRLWIKMARISFENTCRLRSICRIGL